MTRVSKSKRVCVIGANSKIVQSISWPENFELVSHKSLGSLNLSDYEAFVIFSWSHRDNGQNIEIFNALRGCKAIFISSISVLALLVREQWNSYPNDKAVLERLYWEAGNSIIRLGVCSDNYNSSIPFSSPDRILTAILDCVNDVDKKLVTPFELISRKDPSKAERFFYNLSFISNSRIWRILCEAAVKFLPVNRTLLYGYSADCINILVKPLLLGYGAVGSRYFKRKSCFVIVDPRPNILLEKDGFRDTRIGRSIIGLSRFWHGVRVVAKEKHFFKRVPLFIARSLPPLAAIRTPVSHINFGEKKIWLQDDQIVQPYIPYRFVNLAMGPLENSRVLTKYFGKEIKLSDHSIALIGRISTRDLIQQGFLSRFLFIVWGRRVFLSDNKNFMIDFRPTSLHEMHGKNIYNNAGLYIVKKIVSRGSFAALNQAVFNKLGIGLYTKKSDVWIQLVRKNCITVKGNSFMKESFDQFSEATLSEVRKQFPGIVFKVNPNVFDAQHIAGGEDFFNLLNSDDFENKFRARVLGIPGSKPLSAFHHTWDMIEDMNKLLSDSCSSRKGS